MRTEQQGLRAFYMLLATQVVSLVGSQMTGLAVGIKVFNDTGAVLPLALSTLSAAIPFIFAAGIAGFAADRWDRRRILILADVGQAVGTLLLFVTISTGVFQLLHLYVVSFLQAFFGIFQHPAFQASVTMLVPDNQRDRANAIQQLTNPAAGLVAPVLAGLLFTVIGVTGIMLIDLISFGIAITVVLLVHIPQPKISAEGAAARKSIWKEVTAGFRVLWQHRILFYLLISITFGNFLWNLFAVVRTPYVLTVTGSEAVLGVLYSVGSAGFITGGLLISVVRVGQNRGRLILLMLAAIGLTIIPFGIARTPALLGISLFFLHMPHPVVNTLLTSILQLKTPPDVQGRVFAAVTQLVLLAAPVALLLGGFLADYVLEPAVGKSSWSVVEPLLGSEPGAGMGLLMVISGSIYTLLGLVLLSWPRMRRLDTELIDYAP